MARRPDLQSGPARLAALVRSSVPPMHSAGLPFVVLGHNDHIAWSMTTTNGDTQDLFIEKLGDVDGTYVASVARALPGRVLFTTLRGVSTDGPGPPPSRDAPRLAPSARSKQRVPVPQDSALRRNEPFAHRRR